MPVTHQFIKVLAQAVEVIRYAFRCWVQFLQTALKHPDYACKDSYRVSRDTAVDL
jgi:hypothetical protein